MHSKQVNQGTRTSRTHIDPLLTNTKHLAPRHRKEDLYVLASRREPQHRCRRPADRAGRCDQTNTRTAPVLVRQPAPAREAGLRRDKNTCKDIGMGFTAKERLRWPHSRRYGRSIAAANCKWVPFICRTHCPQTSKRFCERFPAWGEDRSSRKMLPRVCHL